MVVYEEFPVATTGRLDVVDVTQEVRGLIKDSGVVSGSVLVYSPHTTCCILIASLGAETIRSLGSAVDEIAPEGTYFAHDDFDIRTENLIADEPANAPAHLAHVFVGKASECIPIVNGDVVLGLSQSILFVELDSARTRRYCVQVLGR
jgi:secondary thiamine-phosphate synthase enzyme